jgi:multidrug resistance efflux pump
MAQSSATGNRSSADLSPPSAKPRSAPPAKRSRKVLFGLFAIIIAAAVALVINNGRHRDLTLIGVIDANDVVVTPLVQARLDSLYVQEGSTVQAGQLIGRLESSELAAQAASVAALASSATAQLAESRASAAQVSGSTDATLAGARARVASARAALVREQAQLAQDSTDVARSQALLTSGAIAQADLDKVTTVYSTQKALVDARQQELAAAEADLENAVAGSHSVIAANSAVATTEARMRSARADSLAAMTRLTYTELRAPVSGIVQVLTARQGELVGPGTPVAVIVNPNDLWVRVAMPETDAGGIALGDSLTVRIASGEELRGRVISKGAEGDFATQRDVNSSKRDIRAVALRIAIPNPKHTLIPGMTAQVIAPTSR